MKNGVWLWVAGILTVASGCLVNQQKPLSPEEVARLRQYQVSAAEAGLTITKRQGSTMVRWREMVRPEHPVTVPMVKRDATSHQPMIQARLNGGRTLSLVVDTGAPVNLLEAGTAMQNHVQTVDADSLQHAFQGLAGTEQTWFGMIRQMTIGSELALRNVLTAIRGARFERRVGGWLLMERWNSDALGMSTLNQFAYIRLDYPAGTVTFSHRDYFTPPDEAVAQAPLIWTNAQLRVPLRLNGKSVEALVDTGNDATLMIASNMLESLGWADLAAKGRREVYVGLGGEHVLRRFLIPEMEFGGKIFKKIHAVGGPEEFGVVIGSGFFHRYCLTLDLRRRQMWLETSKSVRAKST